MRALPTRDVNEALAACGARPIDEPVPLLHLLRRPEVSYRDIARLSADGAAASDRLVARQVEVAVKYEGYVARMLDDVRRFKAAEERLIPAGFDYASVPGLSTEVKERLSALRPRSLGQAGRVPGVTPAALSILMVWCHRQAVDAHGVIGPAKGERSVAVGARGRVRSTRPGADP